MMSKEVREGNVDPLRAVRKLTSARDVEPDAAGVAQMPSREEVERRDEEGAPDRKGRP